MKKIILAFIMMLVGINVAFASNKINIDVISVSSDYVTLEVNVLNVNDDVCYLYRSLDGVNYENHILIDCNRMYVDKNLESGMTYYYKAKYGNNDDYSEVITVFLEDKNLNSLKLTRDINDLSLVSYGFVVVFGITMIVLLICLVLYKKKIV